MLAFMLGLEALIKSNTWGISVNMVIVTCVNVK